MNLEKKTVSIVVPCRNEKDYIVPFINSIYRQDYPSDSIEIIIADGISDDGTLNLLSQLRNHKIRIINNPEQYVSHGLNAAIKLAKGEVIVRMDVHCTYPTNYVSTLVNYLLANKTVGNVGARCQTLPAEPTLRAIAIAQVSSSIVGVGNSSFRIDEYAGVKSVDTVPFGCWRRSLFDDIGFFDTDLMRNQDDEFNQRIIKAGFKVHLITDLSVEYFARKSISSHLKMFYQYGLFKPLVNKKIGKITSLRQLAPPVMLVYIIVTLYLLVINFYSGLVFMFILLGGYSIASLAMMRTVPNVNRTALLVLFIFIAISTHLSYGFGYWRGLFSSNKSKVPSSR